MKSSITGLAVLSIVTLSGCAQLDALFPPKLPTYSEPAETVWLNQNWANDARFWFHHTPQGTQTIPVPYNYFVNLEQPVLFAVGEIPLMRDPAYLARFGFIPSPEGEEFILSEEEFTEEGYKAALPDAHDVAFPTEYYAGNPDGLPVGFALTRDQVDPVTGEPLPPLLGFTCAACHTGQLNYNGVNIRVDGGPAVTNLDSFTKALGAALGQTRIIPWRLTRFAKRIYGDEYSDEKRTIVKNTLDKIIGSLAHEAGVVAKAQGDRNVYEGFARLDALNRIGNQVFFSDMYSADNPIPNFDATQNIAATDAPVNYPHIWSTSWFDWVQYDASIMQPMIRNAGESLGVRSLFNLKQPNELFNSTLLVPELYHMEELIAGPSPDAQMGFQGLTAPKWPEEILGAIDMAKAERGEALYRENCQSCHLPPVSDPAFWSNAFWKPIPVTDPNVPVDIQHREKYLALKTIPVADIGTDPGQAAVLRDRSVKLPSFMNIPEPKVQSGKLICGGEKGTQTDDTAFAWALAYVTEAAVNNRYDKMEPSPSVSERFIQNGERPNCVRAIDAYKARPLNGIWATAPFLHNGSVLTLHDMLIPAAERPTNICLGDLTFDPKKVGMVGACKRGTTEVDTTIAGNLATGHSFENGDGPGIIGPAFTDAQRSDLLEFLKTL